MADTAPHHIRTPARRYRCDVAYERHDIVVLRAATGRVMRVRAAALPLLMAVETEAPLNPSSAEAALLARLEDAGMIHPLPDRADHPPPGPIDPLAGDTVDTVDTVVIVTPVLRRGSITPHTVSGAFVVDDGSAPPLAGAALRLETTRGPGMARMAAVDHLKAEGRAPEFMLFLDADVDPGPDPHWYLPLLALARRDPRLGAVAPRVRATPGPGMLARYEQAHSPLDMGPHPARVAPGTRLTYLPTAALLVRVEALLAVGGFDPDLRFGEDVDLIWRLIDAGWTVRYHPDTVVTHPPRAAWSAWARQRIDYGSSTAPLAQRHGARLAPARLHPTSAAIWGLLIAGHPWGALAVGIWSVRALARRIPGLPFEVVTRMVAVGAARSGLGLAHAVRRCWWPILMFVAVAAPAPVARHVRRGLGFSLLAATPFTPMRALQVADDLCASVGLWRGLWRSRGRGASGTLRPR